MKRSLKIFLTLLLSLFVVLLLTLSLSSLYLSSKLNYPLKEVYADLKSAQASSQEDFQYNILILGYDYRQDAFESSLNTDTIIFANYQTQSNLVSLLALPRDLWDYQNDFKINQIYQKSLDTDMPITNTKTEFERILGTPIDKVLILSTDDIINIVELLGGLDIYLEKGFVDDQYPNQAFIDDPNSGAPIYTTIEFKDGWNHLDSSNITQFIRSRKSSEIASQGGTDLGRIQRQELLINTLIDKLKSDYLYKNPDSALALYHYWQNTLQTDFTNQDLLRIVLNQKKDILDLSIKKYSLTIGESAKDSDIYHPLNFINRQWVFIPSSPDYREIKDKVQLILKGQS